MPHHFFSFFIRIPFLYRILLIALFFILGFGFLIYLIEPATFHTVFEGIWWAIITVSTVGYGDYVPQTAVGKLIGMLLILFGAGFVSTYFVTLASSAVNRQKQKMEGKSMFKGKNHFIIVGWNERSKVVVDKFIHSSKEAVVLIDETLTSSPFPDYRGHFIKGRANTDEVLIRANIYEANKVLITADPTKDELTADMNTILTLLAIKGLNPNVNCIVEVLTEDQEANARRAGADEVIQSNILSASVMNNCLHSPGMISSLMILLEQFNGSRFVFHSSTSYVGKSFTETNKLMLGNGMLLFGIKRGADTFVNPPHPFLVKEKDILLVISPLQKS